MIITSITKIKESVKILFDNEEKLIIRYEVFLKNGFRKGDEISEAERMSLISQNQYFWVKESAFRFLGRRLHSAKELERKLIQKKYDKEMISRVIDELKDSQYLDDFQFARDYAAEKSGVKSLGVNRIRLGLREKGVSTEIIDQVLAEEPDSGEFDNALKIAAKKLTALKGRGLEPQKLNQRLYSYLISKGYNYDIIRKVMDELDK